MSNAFYPAQTRYNQQGFDDLLLDLDRALQRDHTGSLSAAIGALYPCALIDEFQDTDAIQYRIFSKVYLTSPHIWLFIFYR